MYLVLCSQFKCFLYSVYKNEKNFSYTLSPKDNPYAAPTDIGFTFNPNRVKDNTTEIEAVAVESNVLADSVNQDNN